MRRAVALSLAILLLLVPVVRAVGPDDARDVGNVNKIIGVMQSPQLAPGESGEFVFNVSNPYRCGTCAMQNISLNVSIYRYATIEETAVVDAGWPWAFPKLRVASIPPCEGRECYLFAGRPSDRLGVGEHIVERFTVLTSQNMPHGSVFAQSSYFLRFWLEFDFNNGTATRIRMASRGYFTDAQWKEATSNLKPGCGPYNATNRCLGSVNLTRLGVDGLLPDSAFGVKEPIPIWPFYGLLVLTGLFLVLAFLFWVEENPGRYPRVERVWMTFKGRLRRVFRFPRARKV
jgi:hypothetical protein